MNNVCTLNICIMLFGRFEVEGAGGGGVMMFLVADHPITRQQCPQLNLLKLQDCLTRVLFSY